MLPLVGTPARAPKPCCRSPLPGHEESRLRHRFCPGLTRDAAAAERGATPPAVKSQAKSVLQNCRTLASRVERVITPDICLGSPSDINAVQVANALDIKRGRRSVSVVRHSSLFHQGGLRDRSQFRSSSEGYGSSRTVSPECPAPLRERGVRGERTDRCRPRVAKRGGGAGATRIPALLRALGQWRVSPPHMHW